MAQKNNSEIERAVDEQKSQTLHLDWWAFIVATVIVLVLLVVAYAGSSAVKAESAGFVTSVEKGAKGKGNTVIVSYDQKQDTVHNLWPVFVKKDETISSGENIGWKWSDKPLKIPFKEIVKPLLPKKKEG